MKINKNNMKELASNIDKWGLTINNLRVFGVDEDTFINMAYQLQYLFEAMEEIKKRNIFLLSAFKDDRARGEAYKDALDILNNALVDKE